MYIYCQYIMSVPNALADFVQKQSNFANTYLIELAVNGYITVLLSPQIRMLSQTHKIYSLRRIHWQSYQTISEGVRTNVVQVHQTFLPIKDRYLLSQNYNSHQLLYGYVKSSKLSTPGQLNSSIISTLLFLFETCYCYPPPEHLAHFH